MKSVNFKEKTYDQIFEEMIKRSYNLGLVSDDEYFIEHIHNLQDIENMYVLFESVYAFEGRNFYEDMALIYNSFDIDKAQGKDLDKIGKRYGIIRPRAKKSTVELVFFLNSSQATDITIPQGTIVSTVDGRTYTTIETKILTNGSNQIKIGAKSSITGYNSRVGKNTLTRIVNLNISGLSVTNPLPSYGGRSIFNDIEYRNLLKNHIRSKIRGTKEAYDLFFANYESINSYNLIPKWDGTGTVEVVIDPANDFLINDISNLLYKNVQFGDEDVFVTGVTYKTVDIDAVINVDIDEVIPYSSVEKEDIKLRVENAIKIYIDGGYRRNGLYYKGLTIGEDVVPYLLGLFIKSEVPEVKSIDWQDTVKKIDNILYPSEFYMENNCEKCKDGDDSKLHSKIYSKFLSPKIYLSDVYKVIIDGDGWIFRIIKDNEVIYEIESNAFIIDEKLDTYGSYIELENTKGCNSYLNHIKLYESNKLNDKYNEYIIVNNTEKAVSGELNIIVS